MKKNMGLEQHEEKEMDHLKMKIL